MTKDQLYSIAEDWFFQQDWKPFGFLRCTLSHEIKQSSESVACDSETSLTVGIRSGDTGTSERAKQKKDQVFVIAEGMIIKI
jgi:hypothetical protein